MTRAEIISDVRELLRKHNIDSEIADRHILFLTRTKRAKYLRQREMREMGEYKDQFYQSLFLELELVDSSRIPTILPTGGTVLRTKKSIPNIVGREIFDHMDVRTVEYTGKEIEVLDKIRISSVDSAPDGFIYCYKEDDGKLYFYSTGVVHKNLNRVVVQCILEDPEDIVAINELTEPLTDYPITGEVWEIVRNEIIQLLTGGSTIPIDTLNNKADDIAAPTQE